MRTRRGRLLWFPLALIIVGVVLLLKRFHVVWVDWQAVFWLLLACAGGVELINGIARRSRGKIVWGTIWVAVGGMCFLHAEDALALSPGILVGGIFLASGAGFLAALARNLRDWYLAVPGVCCLLLGVAIVATDTGWLPEQAVVPLVSTWWPAGLILFGAALVAHAVISPGRRLSGPPASSSPSPHPQ